MALSFVGANHPNPPGSTLAVPAGVQAGDLLLLIVNLFGTGSAALTITGYTKTGHDTHSADRFASFYRVATATSGDTPSIPALNGYSLAAYRHVGAPAVYSGDWPETSVSGGHVALPALTLPAPSVLIAGFHAYSQFGSDIFSIPAGEAAAIDYQNSYAGASGHNSASAVWIHTTVTEPSGTVLSLNSSSTAGEAAWGQAFATAIPGKGLAMLI